jgi:hypothetical protein
MDAEPDILSHGARRPQIHILTLDMVLAEDVYERLHNHRKTRFYQLVIPKERHWKRRSDEIERMAIETTGSRLLILDVRKVSLPRLQQAYNKVAGYNRRDLNKLCYILLIGDGPLNLYQPDKPADVFVPYLADLRVDYTPAAFFFDPFIHYEPDEVQSSIDDELVFSDALPKRLAKYFSESGLTVAEAREYFRAVDEDDEIKNKRLRILAALFKKCFIEHFPNEKELFNGLLTKEGIRLATERMNLYPIFFEEWVNELMQKAAQPGQ